MKRTMVMVLALLLLSAGLLGCQANPAGTPNPTVDPAAAPGSTGEPVVHDFPEPLLEFGRRRDQKEPYDLSRAAKMQVAVNHCEYGEPVQNIADAQIIAEVIAALGGITVTGDHDSVASTGTYYAYSMYDADDTYLCGFAFQDGMLMEREGRFPITGLSALLAVEGVQLEKE